MTSERPRLQPHNHQRKTKFQAPLAHHNHEYKLLTLLLARHIAVLSFTSLLHCTHTLANYLKAFAQHAVPKYLRIPERVLRISHIDWGKKKGVAGRFDRQAMMDPTPEDKPGKAEKSYLTAAVESITPWSTSRSSTPKPASLSTSAPPVDPAKLSGLKNQHGGRDHTTQQYGLSLKDYPTDCPKLSVRWFHAVDVCLHPQSVQTWGSALIAHKNRFPSESRSCSITVATALKINLPPRPRNLSRFPPTTVVP